MDDQQISEIWLDEVVPILERSVLRPWRRRGWHDMAELEGEAWAAALVALRQYDPEAPYSMGGYLATVVRRRLVDYLRSAYGRSHSETGMRKVRTSVSLDAPMTLKGDSSKVTLADTLGHQEEGYAATEDAAEVASRAALVEELVARWDDPHLREAVLSQADETVLLQDLGEAWGVTQSRACQVRARGNARVRAALGHRLG